MNFITEKFKYNPDASVYGLTKDLIALYIANYYHSNDENVLILTSTLYEANNFYKLIGTYVDDVLFFPMDDFLASVALAISPDLKAKRLETLEKISKENKKHLVVTSLMGYLKYLPSKNEETSFNLQTGAQNISREIILDKLQAFGYNRESLVTTTGEYAVRGYIIDVFPASLDKPVRLEFFDDELEKIKYFDETTQLTTEEIPSVEIKRFNEEITDQKNSLMDYLSNQTCFFIDPGQIDASYSALQEEIVEYNLSAGIDTHHMFQREEIATGKVYNIACIDNKDDEKSINYTSKSLENFAGNMDTLCSFCQKELKKKRTICLALDNSKQVTELKEIFPEAIITNIEKIFPNQINIFIKEFSHGFQIDDIVLITPKDIVSQPKEDIKYKSSIKIGRKVKNYTELEIGDYIVHEQYGIGIYKGLKTIQKQGLAKDFVELVYDDDDKLYLPIDKINKLYKYSSNLGRTVKLSKLGGTTWAKKKSETRQKIHDISGELLDLYRNRSRAVGTPYKDFDEEFTFAFAFPYTLTPDQDKVIKEIDADLRSSTPMDRLLCGDVGYGKTEVAFRAMFKTVMNGFQVSYLCPTTILSKQQYTSCQARFKDFPIKIELLNRHISTKKVNEVIAGLKSGQIDIVIGTHKLLNDAISYKRLGLLVIDEEQRFGVTHKEKIKKLKNDVNVLTLSATPIPRTLKMAMSGLRSLSVLDTPPINRYPIQTYVIEENMLLIKDAIYKELTRDGQVFILINSIEELENFKTKLSLTIPEARVICGHGRMTSEQLNTVMEKFIDGLYDILICTTIIETGIDIPNVNTIIIIDADRFGLSQLYQIRGRVGRSDKIAYAYLMYKPARLLTETATKRLESIKEFTELGSGYKVAMRDLSIRGAGDLLGSEQAGFIDAIGLDLYTKMVNEEVSKLEGTYQEEKENPIAGLLPVYSHIEDDYVDDESVKIEIHKLINTIKTPEDLENVKKELIDRFGQIDENIETYMLTKCTENLMEILGITKINQLNNTITIVLPEELSNVIDGEKLFLQAYNITPKFKISYINKEIRISLDISKLNTNYIHYIYDLIRIIKEQNKIEV